MLWQLHAVQFSHQAEAHRLWPWKTPPLHSFSILSTLLPFHTTSAPNQEGKQHVTMGLQSRLLSPNALSLHHSFTARDLQPVTP